MSDLDDDFSDLSTLPNMVDGFLGPLKWKPRIDNIVEPHLCCGHTQHKDLRDRA